MARPHLLRRYQFVLLLAVVGIIIAIVLLQALANAYTNYLWYRSIDETMIWRSMVETKLGLGIVFCGIFFIACWASLWAVDTLAPADIYLQPEYDVVRRYRASFGRYRVTVRTFVSLVLALIVGAGTSSQWQHWLLFVNGGSFPGSKSVADDPQFHRNVGFYVFRLPFLSFLVDWSLVALLVLAIVTAVAHYLNGGLRFSGPSPRVDRHVISHISLILALMALVRAAGYFFVDRYALDLSTNGVVEGAGYTDVHVRLPAMSVLAIVSLIGFVLLTFNVYHRTLIYPAVAIGLWAFIALMLGVVFPAFVQWLQVNPSESTVELPYIQRNIAFTRNAFDLNSVTAQNFAAHTDLKATVINANHESLDDLPLWNPSVASATYSNLQLLHGYYQLADLSADRYELGTGSKKSLTPVVIGVRELNQSGEPRKTWVNEHLEYTHGYGVVIAPSNASTKSGLPDFSVEGAPVHSSPGAPSVSQPDIYFGSTPSTYVIADTKQPELDYVQGNSSKPSTNHYSGSGGVRLSGFLQRAAYAIKFHDFNLLVSHLITSKSRIIYQQDVEQLVQRAAPFLKVDSHPYPVVAGGQVYWMVDGYTTSDSYPYSEDANTSLLAGTSGLQGQYNYARDAVKAVVNAYTGKVTLFAADSSDPILIAWEHAYPGLIKPLKDMATLTPSDPGALLQHLRYPQDLLTVLSTMYGRYHFLPTANQAQQFYSLQNAWNVAAGSGGSYTPTYELLRLPGDSSSEFVAVEPLVPQSSTGGSQLLSGFITADSDYGDYGDLTAYELPKLSSSAVGPSLAASKIQSNSTVSSAMTLLDQHSSRVIVGPTLLVPIDDSFIYVEAIYVTSTARAFPALEYVATDFAGDEVGFSTSLLDSLRQLFGSSVANLGPTSSETLSQQIETYLARAYAEYQQSVIDEKNLQLGKFQTAIKQMGADLTEAHRLLAQEKSSSTSTSSSAPGSSSPSTSGGSSTTSTSTSTTTTPSTSSTTNAPKAAAVPPGSDLTAESTTTTTQAPRMG